MRRAVNSPDPTTKLEVVALIPALHAYARTLHINARDAEKLARYDHAQYLFQIAQDCDENANEKPILVHNRKPARTS